LFLSQVGFRSCQIFKRKKTSCPFSSLRKLKRPKSDGTEGFSADKTKSFALSDCGLYFNQEEWLKELKDTSLANEAKGQTIVSKNVSRMKRPWANLEQHNNNATNEIFLGKEITAVYKKMCLTH